MNDLLSTLDARPLLAHDAGGAREETVDHVNRQIYRSFEGRQDSQAAREIFRLRHEVYCIERAFLDPDDYFDNLECDDYDEGAMHFAAYTMDESLIGTVRLVQPAAPRPFPFELHCATFAGFSMPPREQCGEVSRLAVRRSHRRRRADSVIGIPGLCPSQAAGPAARKSAGERRERCSPMLLLGMYREMIRHSRRHGVRWWFAAMERSLAYSLERMGFRFEPIGPPADYYGAVTPYVLDLSELSAALATANPVLAAWFDEAPLLLAKRRVGNWDPGLGAEAPRHASTLSV